VLLFIAVGRRLSDYGMTEQRYLMVLIGIWALVLAVFRLLRGSNFDLRLVPGVQVCEQDGQVWVRGEQADDSLRRRLLVLPESYLFAVVDGGEIVLNLTALAKGFTEVPK
jgi:hypothetical protein